MFYSKLFLISFQTWYFGTEMKERKKKVKTARETDNFFEFERVYLKQKNERRKRCGFQQFRVAGSKTARETDFL